MERRLRDWILVLRPWAFSASVVPVAAVSAWLGWRGGPWDGVNAVLSVVVIAFLHAGADVLSDCRDHESGVDFRGAPNGVTWIQDGRFGLAVLRRYAVALLAVGALLGCVILQRSAWQCLWVGAAGLAIAAGYSFLKYRACGDLAVFLAFVVLPALGVGAVVSGVWSGAAVLVALPPGLLTLSILNANNIRDVVRDGRAGCRTLPQAIGLRRARGLYVAETVLPYALVAGLLTARLLPYAAVGVFLTLPLAARNVAALRRGELDALDRSSARLQLLFGLLYVLAFPVGLLGFWGQLALGSVVTGALAVRNLPRDVCRNWLLEGALGATLATALWGVFRVGDAVARQLFDFAAGQVASVYALREGCSPVWIGAALLLLIGPAEELFWRGLVQRGLAERWGRNAGFALATLAYALIHVWSFNFMLVGAAAVCGLFWGLSYRFFPRHLPALVFSHALWDVAVFVIFPIGAA